MMLNVLGCQLTYQGQAETNAEAWFNIALRPRKSEGSLGRTAQDGHLDSHTAPELLKKSCYTTIKCTVLQACMCALFSPEIVQALAVKGLTLLKSSVYGHPSPVAAWVSGSCCAWPEPCCGPLASWCWTRPRPPWTCRRTNSSSRRCGHASPTALC